MKVYDDDGAESIIQDEFSHGNIESIEDLVEVLRTSHEDARAVIAYCDEKADELARGIYPAWLVEKAKEEAEDFGLDNPHTDQWVRQVLSR